ncbi:hypothetical protein LPJ66_007566 [Kickxella alabastrina]|uniref:Uncharacterized protein n=1 Tax=Kickxella alabastrina TaxID=61397 RepID=A0ACC1I8L3_9FUNG|nr:hypothetical protein LPJ66_007566 [Kickxella alabastrina]
MNNYKLFPSNHQISRDTASNASIGTGPGLSKRRRRPPYSYTALIAQAIIISTTKQLTLREIYDSINRMYPQICQGPDVGWQNTIRHNLSLNQCFQRIPRHQLSPSQSSRLRGKGSYWTVDVELMDPNTRKRLEEAVASGTSAIMTAMEVPATAVVPSSNEQSRHVRKKTKTSHSATSSESSDLLLPNISMPVGANKVLSVASQSYRQSANSNRSPYLIYDRDNIQYVSPAIQSSSPYFQSSMNSPISTTMPAIESKHMSSPIPRGHFSDSRMDLPPMLPSLSSVMPHGLQSGGRYYSRIALKRCESGTVRSDISQDSRVSSANMWDSGSDSPPPMDNAGLSTMTYANSHNLFGTTILCARSTARSQTQGQNQGGRGGLGSDNSLPQASSLSASLYRRSPYSLSPASTVMPLNDSCANSDSKDASDSEKLSINHLLN